MFPNLHRIGKVGTGGDFQVGPPRLLDLVRKVSPRDGGVVRGGREVLRLRGVLRHAQLPSELG